MNWSRAKSILIFLFLCINIFLGIYMVKANRSVSLVPDKTITQIEQLLEYNQIHIDESQIPTKIPVMHDIDANNSITDFNALAVKLVGEGYSVANQGTLYMNGSKRMAVSADSFLYENVKPTEYYPGLSQSNAETKGKEIARWLGLDIKNADTVITALENNTIEVKFISIVDGYPFFDSMLTIGISQNGLHTVSGAWFSPQNSKMKLGTRIKSAPGILVDFISDPLRPKSQPVTIKEMVLGYLSGDTSTYHKSITAVPTWRIVTEDGGVYYMDARVR